jgi:8-oxo-dGTP diphosphatase
MTYYLVLPFCLALIKNENGEVLIGRHAISPRKPYPGYWDLPGGKLENGETPVECIKREVKEELGVEVTDLKLLDVFHHDDRTKYPQYTQNLQSIGFCYECKVKGKIVPTEQEEVHYATSEELRTLLLTPWCSYFINK